MQHTTEPAKPTREHLVMEARGLQKQIDAHDEKIKHEQQERSKIVRLFQRKKIEIAAFDVEDGETA